MRVEGSVRDSEYEVLRIFGWQDKGAVHRVHHAILDQF